MEDFLPGPPIPISTRPFFQEYDFLQLDLHEHVTLIIERILAYGNRSEVRWLLKTYGKDQVKAWVDSSGVYRLPFRRYNLWCFVFGLEKKERKRSAWPH
jgi:hypothetical protein